MIARSRYRKCQKNGSQPGKTGCGRNGALFRNADQKSRSVPQRQMRAAREGLADVHAVRQRKNRQRRTKGGHAAPAAVLRIQDMQQFLPPQYRYEHQEKQRRSRADEAGEDNQRHGQRENSPGDDAFLHPLPTFPYRRSRCAYNSKACSRSSSV